MSVLDNDYMDTLGKEVKSKNHCYYRMLNEPSPFFDALSKELEEWEKLGLFDVFVRNFTTKNPWRAEALLMSKPDIRFINGVPLIDQWRLANGKDLEYVAKRAQVQ